MSARILPRNSFEQQLPDGWFLSRLYRGNRVLYYRDIKVKSIPDDFSIQENVYAIISNPPAAIQHRLYEEGRLTIEALDTKVQKKLIKNGIISFEEALKRIPTLCKWLMQLRPRCAEYAGHTYTGTHKGWISDDGVCIKPKALFQSSWDARVRYAKGIATLSDVARYSWSTALECLGDDHQRIINQIIKPKLENNRKGWVYDAKDKKAQKLEANKAWVGTEWDLTEDIADEYREDINSSIYHHFFASVGNQKDMFTKKCLLPGFDTIHTYIKNYNKRVIKELGFISPELSGFRWNSTLGSYEPSFSPARLSTERRNDFFVYVNQVLTGAYSGHEAALRFSNKSWSRISRETKRYSKHMTQHVPYYSNLWKLNNTDKSFSDIVTYVRDSVRDLIAMGFRDESRRKTAFVYDDCRFCVDIDNGEVQFLGLSGGKFMSDKWIAMKPEQRRAYLSDDVEWEYQERAIKSYNRLLSYLSNVIHKHWDKASCYIKDKIAARNKYLKPSPRFLAKIKGKAEEYIKSLERGVVIC